MSVNEMNKILHHIFVIIAWEIKVKIVKIYVAIKSPLISSQQFTVPSNFCRISSIKFIAIYLCRFFFFHLKHETPTHNSKIYIFTK